MPDVVLKRPRRHHHGPRARAILVAGHRRVELPIAPREVVHTGDAPVITAVDRPGRRPLTFVSSDGLRVLTFTAIVDAGDDGIVEGLIRRLRRMANAGRPVVFQYGSQLEAGLWRISGLDLTVLLRDRRDRATRMSVDVALTEATDVQRHNGPVGGGSDEGPGGPHKPRVYTWRKGDTPAKVSRKFYGRPDLFDLIARANHIRHPRRIKVGTKLRIPPRQGIGTAPHAPAVAGELLPSNADLLAVGDV